MLATKCYRYLGRLQPAIIVILIFLYMYAETQQATSRSSTNCEAVQKSKNPVHDSLESESSIKTFPYKGPYRAWPKWEQEFPCFPSELNWKAIRVQRSPADTGIMFLREMKTGSSTVAGILLRLAHRYSTEIHDGTIEKPCRLRIDHSSARVMNYTHRKRSKSFLLSLLRDPTQRAISHYFHFKVSEDKEDPTDENFQLYFRSHAQKWSNYYIKDLGMEDYHLDSEGFFQHEENNAKITSSSKDDSIVKNILAEYDFVAITERLDESLVVLKHLLNLDMEDILYMSAKKHGSFTAGSPGNRCIYIIPPFRTEGMNEFFQSNYWRNYIRLDQRLYDAAVKSLDKTIDSLGRDIIQQELESFLQARKAAQELCDHRTIYRCNSKGTFVGAINSTCYLWDIGCGYTCLNDLTIGPSGEVSLRLKL
jgi:Galactose-3-O-sulfotransferase